MQTPSNLTSSLQAHGEAGGADCWPWLDGVPAQLAAPLGNHGEIIGGVPKGARKPSPLVLCGSEIKIRLEAERFATRTPVHVDWLRFTCRLRLAPPPSVDLMFPLAEEEQFGVTLAEYVAGQTYAVSSACSRARYIHRLITSTPDCEASASVQARELADRCAEILGPDFMVADQILKGQDFYRFKWSIQRSGVEVGWVGYLASGSSPKQKAQSNTIHANLHGTACTFARIGWLDDMAALIDDHKADITRADLALDFFDGYSGGLNQVEADYLAGLWDVRGRRPKCNNVGDWTTGRALNSGARSFYVGSKEGGKQTNVYEKGDQLFGIEAGSKWLRFELRYGNKLRVLPSDILRRPADFFAGASPYHAQVLSQAEVIPCPEPITVAPRLAAQTVEAEVTRNLRWAFNVAAPTIAAAWDYLGKEFLNLVTDQKLPGRLSKFSKTELATAFEAAKARFSQAGESVPLAAFA